MSIQLDIIVNNVQCPELIVSQTIDIKDKFIKYIYEGKNKDKEKDEEKKKNKDEEKNKNKDEGKIIYTAKTKLVISVIIQKAKQEIKDIIAEKKRIDEITKFIKNINKIQKNINIFNNYLETNTLLDDCGFKLEDIQVVDGNAECRKKAQESFDNHKIYAKQVLEYLKQSSNNSSIVEIKKRCIDNISEILNKNNIRAHRVSAIVILNDNGLNIPSSY